MAKYYKMDALAVFVVISSIKLVSILLTNWAIKHNVSKPHHSPKQQRKTINVRRRNLPPTPHLFA
jgi:hypothetical protein